eukprot:Skav215750  [mRNA]  locus=scaffold106:174880:175220:- [translate_table: standard]
MAAAKRHPRKRGEKQLATKPDDPYFSRMDLWSPLEAFPVGLDLDPKGDQPPVQDEMAKMAGMSWSR